MTNTTLRSILLVDDDEDDIALFRDTLKEVNHNTVLIILQNGDKLLHFLADTDELPDVVLLDLHMPLKDGYECLQEIRDQERFRTMPVFVLSTSGFSRNVQRAYEQGADMYMQKPDTVHELKMIIEFLDKMDWSTFRKPSIEHFVFPEIRY